MNLLVSINRYGYINQKLNVIEIAESVVHLRGDSLDNEEHFESRGYFQTMLAGIGNSPSEYWAVNASCCYVGVRLALRMHSPVINQTLSRTSCQKEEAFSWTWYQSVA